MNDEEPKLISRKFHHYEDAYRREFDNYEPLKILEIGVASGGSLHQLKSLYPHASIVGIDIDPRCILACGEDIRVLIGNQRDRNFLIWVGKTFGPFDIIIDDGCHRGPWQRTSFDILWHYVKEPGCYCVEDLQTSYMPLWRFGNWGGSFLNYARKKLISSLHGYWRRQGTDKLTIRLGRVVFYDSIVFIHKVEPRIKPALVVRGEIDLQAS